MNISAAEPLRAEDDNSPPVAAIVGPVIAGVVAMIIFVAFVVCRKRLR